jgi:pimeloyl-ACP methyl ester carboxylesterase
MIDDPTRAAVPNRAEALAARNRLFEPLDVTQRVVHAAGVETTVVEGGAGPPLVLLHGQGGSALAWLPPLRAFLRTHRVVIPDLPGLGESTLRDHHIDPERIVAWLTAVFAATCEEPPTVVGLSLGGTFAAHLGVRDGDAARRIVLADSGSLGRFRPDPRTMPALIRLSTSPSEPRLERFFRHTVADLDRFKRWWGDRWPDFVAYGLERAATPEVQAVNRLLLRRVGVRRIPDADLGGIETPVRLVWGAEDRIMKPRIAHRAASRFGWPLHLLEDCGHASCWDHPDAFVDAVAAPWS